MPYLVEIYGHVPWERDDGEPHVRIRKPLGGVGNLQTELRAELKASGLETLGLIVDADEHLEGRWEAVKQVVSDQFPEVPEHLPQEGLIVQNAHGLRFGAWLMPDNVEPGMVETFLSRLVARGDKVWDLAEKSTEQAKSIGAPFKASHRDKAVIHTWLAWQDPPGAQLHEAVYQRIFDVDAPEPTKFVRWFRELYDF